MLTFFALLSVLLTEFPPLMVSDFLTSAIEHILNADRLRAIAGNNLTMDHCFDIADI